MRCDRDASGRLDLPLMLIWQVPREPTFFLLLSLLRLLS